MRRTWLTACLLVAASAAGAAGHNWQLAGKTYNSVAFVDLNSIASGSGFKSFTAIRVSGQPEADGWTSVVQQLAVNCSTRVFVDAGSRIEKTGGTTISYPGFGATQKALSRGVFFDMFEIVCNGRSGDRVADPRSWTRQNFKPGD